MSATDDPCVCPSCGEGLLRSRHPVTRRRTRFQRRRADGGVAAVGHSACLRCGGTGVGGLFDDYSSFRRGHGETMGDSPPSSRRSVQLRDDMIGTALSPSGIVPPVVIETNNTRGVTLEDDSFTIVSGLTMGRAVDSPLEVAFEAPLPPPPLMDSPVSRSSRSRPGPQRGWSSESVVRRARGNRLRTGTGGWRMSFESTDWTDSEAPPLDAWLADSTVNDNNDDMSANYIPMAVPVDEERLRNVAGADEEPEEAERPISRSTSTGTAVYCVSVPENIRPGDEFPVLAEGRVLTVRCPPRASPGTRVQITVHEENRSARLNVERLRNVAGANEAPEEAERPISRSRSKGTAVYCVSVPENIGPGDDFPVLAEGRVLTVRCPHRAGPGTKVQITVYEDNRDVVPQSDPAAENADGEANYSPTQEAPPNEEKQRNTGVINVGPEETDRLVFSPSTGGVAVYCVTIPQGIQPGDDFPVRAGDRVLTVRCPLGASPGTGMQITVDEGPVGAASRSDSVGGTGHPQERMLLFRAVAPPAARPGHPFEACVEGRKVLVPCPANVAPGGTVLLRLPASLLSQKSMLGRRPNKEENLVTLKLTAY